MIQIEKNDIRQPEVLHVSRKTWTFELYCVKLRKPKYITNI